MRGIYKKVGVMLAAGALACSTVGLAGCATESVPVSDLSRGNNTQLAYTDAEAAEPQNFEKVTFGTYQQEPISWLKLAEQDGKTLLISEYVLDAMPYSDVDEGVTWGQSSPRPTTDVDWADSSLRSWLNGEFAQVAFSADEQGAIAEVSNVDTKNNAVHSAANAADPSVHVASESQDRVFLLSVAEAKQYFANNAARAAYPTNYALSQGVYAGVPSNPDQADGAAIWWLRTPGYYGGYEAVVADDGYVHGAGYRINGELHDGWEDHGSVNSELGGNVGVRPCIWVETSALG